MCYVLPVITLFLAAGLFFVIFLWRSAVNSFKLKSIEIGALKKELKISKDKVKAADEITGIRDTLTKKLRDLEEALAKSQAAEAAANLRSSSYEDVVAEFFASFKEIQNPEAADVSSPG